jgi:hypothetical protein
MRCDILSSLAHFHVGGPAWGADKKSETTERRVYFRGSPALCKAG